MDVPESTDDWQLKQYLAHPPTHGSTCPTHPPAKLLSSLLMQQPHEAASNVTARLLRGAQARSPWTWHWLPGPRRSHFSTMPVVPLQWQRGNETRFNPKL